MMNENFKQFFITDIEFFNSPRQYFDLISEKLIDSPYKHFKAENYKRIQNKILHKEDKEIDKNQFPENLKTLNKVTNLVASNQLKNILYDLSKMEKDENNNPDLMDYYLENILPLDCIKEDKLQEIYDKFDFDKYYLESDLEKLNKIFNDSKNSKNLFDGVNFDEITQEHIDLIVYNENPIEFSQEDYERAINNILLGADFNEADIEMLALLNLPFDCSKEEKGKVCFETVKKYVDYKISRISNKKLSEEDVINEWQKVDLYVDAYATKKYNFNYSDYSNCKDNNFSSYLYNSVSPNNISLNIKNDFDNIIFKLEGMDLSSDDAKVLINKAFGCLKHLQNVYNNINFKNKFSTILNKDGINSTIKYMKDELGEKALKDNQKEYIPYDYTFENYLNFCHNLMHSMIDSYSSNISERIEEINEDVHYHQIIALTALDQDLIDEDEIEENELMIKEDHYADDESENIEINLDEIELNK